MAETPTNAYPNNRAEGINWCELRTETVEFQAAELGVTVEDAAAFVAATTRAAASNRAYEQARNKAAALAKAARADFAALSRRANGVVADARFKAEESPNPADVLQIADIEPRQPASPSTPPLAPTNVRCALGTDGVNTVTWTGSTDRTSFSVQRQLLAADGTPSGWTPFGGAVTRPFRDATVPAGTTSASYRVQALRTGLFSAWSEPGTLQLVPLSESTSPLRIAA